MCLKIKEKDWAFSTLQILLNYCQSRYCNKPPQVTYYPTLWPYAFKGITRETFSQKERVHDSRNSLNLHGCRHNIVLRVITHVTVRGDGESNSGPLTRQALRIPLDQRNNSKGTEVIQRLYTHNVRVRTRYNILKLVFEI